ncbi:MAG TPA: molybdopterin-dependent oxidoreductase [Aquihabitans sp.]|nr:molybdopterin-dependent oxidoreductase [Aquihabitans sp.]
MPLPPGQRAVEGFPRFGTHLDGRPPRVPAHPAIEVAGAVRHPFEVPLGDLAALPRREVEAAFHCVAGWSATGLTWEGVAFETFFAEVVEPALVPGGRPVTHVVFAGLDGYRSLVELVDATAPDVLLAEHLDGEPFGADHGAPVRLVSPGQYGFMSTKHLCRIELHTDEPSVRYHPDPLARFGLELLKPHRRARVWEEERHRYLPAWSVRHVYRSLIGPIKAMCARGARPRPDEPSGG